MKRVRMLVDSEVEGLKYKCSQVVDFPDAIAKDLINNGEADGAKGAVDYCVNELKLEPLVHEAVAERAVKSTVKSAKKALEKANAAFEAETDAGKRAALGKQVEAAEAALTEAKAKASAAAK